MAENASEVLESGDTTNISGVKSLFSKTKKKIKPATVQSMPPPPPPPAPKVMDSTESLSSDEGWEREFQRLDSFLRDHGLCITRVDADGSCLFSSFACHFPKTTSTELRQEAVRYMLLHPDDFEPFIDTEAYPGGFRDYCIRMLQSTTWGSQLELQALSQCRKVNVCVFQTGGKSRIDMVNFSETEASCVTVSYHEGEHYNTVMRVADEEESEYRPLSYKELMETLALKETSVLAPAPSVEPVVTTANNPMKKRLALFK